MTGGEVAAPAIQVSAEVLGHHAIAAVLVDDDGVRWANQAALETVFDVVDDVRDPDVLLGRLREGLTIEGAVADLAPGTTREVRIELATNRVLLARDGLAVGVDGPASALVTFDAAPTELTDPAHLARLETMLEATVDIIAVLDHEGRVRYANGAGRRLTGLSGMDVNGRGVADLVHPDDVDRAVGHLVRAVSGEEVGAIEIELMHADGTYHPVEAEVTGTVTVDDAPAFVVTIRDISERLRRQAEQMSARRRLEALVEDLEEVIVVLDEDLDVTWTSPGIQRLIDAPAYTNLGEHAFNDIHPDDVEGVAAALTAVQAAPGKNERAEFRLHHQRRGWRWVEATVVNRLDDPDLGGLVCTLRDITEQRDADAELQRLREADREEMARLREADRLKDLFLATVSHELRTPLTSVTGFSGLLTGPYDLEDEQREDLIARIHTNAKEMERMIEQLLELSRLQAGRVDLQRRRVPVGEAVGALVESLADALAGHDVGVEVGDLAVLADPRALEQVLRNLLTNAVRYSETGTRITVEAERVGGEIVVRVRDEGVGIAPAEQSRIFESFYQADIATAGRRGTGIGLNIARRYAQLLGGRLTVESEVGVGSTFSLRLPAAD